MSCARIMAALGTPDLTAFQQLVFAVLVGWADGNSCRVTIQAIADHLNRSTQRATVYRAIEALAEKNLIRIERAAHGVSRYHILAKSVLATEQHRVSHRATRTLATEQHDVATEQHDQSSERATQNGGNQPNPEAAPRARVDSPASIKKEEEGTPIFFLTPDSDSGVQDKLPVGEKRARAKRQRPASAFTTIPDGWFPDEAGRQYARDRGVPRSEVESFVNYHQAKGTQSASWAASWRTWCNKFQQFHPQSQPAAPSATARGHVEGYRASFGY